MFFAARGGPSTMNHTSITTRGDKETKQNKKTIGRIFTRIKQIDFKGLDNKSTINRSDFNN